MGGAFSGRVDCHKPEGRNGNQRDLFAAGINDVHERRIPHSLTRGRKTATGPSEICSLAVKGRCGDGGGVAGAIFQPALSPQPSCSAPHTCPGLSLIACRTHRPRVEPVL